eukprot:s705_g18.t1
MDNTYTPPEPKSRSQTPKSRKPHHGDQEAEHGWEWNWGESTPRATGKNRTRRRRKQSQQGEVPAYAAPAMPPPWTSTEATPAEAREVLTTSSAPSATANEIALAQHLQETYPNPEDRPAWAKEAIEKAGIQASRHLKKEMHRTTDVIDRSHQTLQKLQDARRKHKDSWMKHLKALIETLDKQMIAYDNQQKDYVERIKTARRDIHKARRDMQRLNAQAAIKPVLGMPIEEEEEEECQLIDKEEQELRQQVQAALKKVVASTDPMLVEIKSESDDGEEMEDGDGRSSKRPRSSDRSTSAPVEDAENLVEACHSIRWDGAACHVSGYTLPPPYNREYDYDEHCTFPFMAIHSAYVLANQVSKASTSASTLSILSSPCSRPSTSISHCPLLRPCIRQGVCGSGQQVTFSTSIDLWMIDEDEIGASIPQCLHERDLHAWVDKSWALRQRPPRQCHAIDDHMRPARERMDAEFPQRPPQQALAATIEQQPDHIQDLDIALHQYGELDPATQGRRMEVLSWFLHGHFHRDCRQPRPVHLNEDFLTWNDELHAVWQDRIDPWNTIHHYVVLPEPPIAGWETHAAHILLVQRPVRFEQAVLFTAVYHAPDQVAIQRIATFSATPVHLDECLDKAEIPHQVRHRPIQASYGWRTIARPPRRAADLQDGASVVIHVRPPIDSGARSSTDLDHLWEDTEPVPDSPHSRSRSPRRAEPDETILLAHRPQLHLPAPAVPLLDHEGIAQDPGNEDHAEETPSSSTASESLPDPMGITEFFHLFRLRTPYVTARLRSATRNLFLRHLQQVLRLNPHDLQTFHRPRHLPQDLRLGQSHAVLIQMSYDLGPGDTRQLVLVDIDFHNHAPVRPTTKRFVSRLPDPVSRLDLLEYLGLDRYCAAVQQQCIVWINGVMFSRLSQATHPIVHGDYIHVAVPPIPHLPQKTCHLARGLLDGYALEDAEAHELFVDTDAEWPVDASDDTSLLQRPVAPQVLQLEKLIDAPSQVMVDFSAVEYMKAELCHLPLDPLHDWPAELVLEDVTREALTQLQPVYDLPPRAVHFYVDGSKVQGHGVGAAVAALVDTDHGTFPAGILAKTVDFVQHSYLGEHAAMIWALLWALQFSEWLLVRFGTCQIQWWFHFDALNTGYQSAGWWRSHEHKEWQTMMRALVHILEHRHGARHLHWEHVRAHTNHPWNELVDKVAKYASIHGDCVGNCDAWRFWLVDGDKLTALQWIWYLEKMRGGNLDTAPLHGLHLVHCISSCADQLDVVPDTSSCSHDNPPVVIALEMTVATANVLTLSHSDDRHQTSITRQRLLMTQFDEAGCHLVGVQETRHRHLCDRSNSMYHMVGHPASADGQHGVQLWVSKTKPLFEHGPCVRSSDLLIVDPGPAHLVVKLQMRHWRCLVVVAHAPHSGHDESKIAAFWHHLSARIRQFVRCWPIIFLGDTNGHLGEQVTQAVGSWHASHENRAGAAFHQWMLEHHLFAPATFEDYLTGPLHHTYVSPDGQREHRIDYVALSASLNYDQVVAWTAEDIDLSTQRTDHLPALCRFALRRTISSTTSSTRCRARQRGASAAFATAMQSSDTFHALRESVQMPPWTSDPHSTADTLAFQTQLAVDALVPHNHRVRRKTHLSEKAWELIDHKRHCFRQLRSLQRSWRHTKLKVMFQAWRTGASAPGLCGWQILSDHAIATTSRNHRLAAQAVTALVRQEDAQYYKELATKAGHTYTVEGLTALWKQLKAVLPRHRVRQSVQRFDLGDDLLQHFTQLEAGTSTTLAAHRRDCQLRNDEVLAAQPPLQFIALDELPTLAETEDLCLRQRPHKAAGPDGLSSNVCRYGAAALSPHLHGVMLKAFLSGTEPVRYKGGLLIPIWKQKGSQTVAASYRGILLSDTYGKVYHAWLRRRLLPTLLQRRVPGQLGGLPAQQALSGIQLLRLHGRIGRHRLLSTSVIFIDLRSAFHHLLREFVFTDSRPMNFDELRRVLDSADFSLEELANELTAAVQRPRADVPAGLRRSLADAHQHTWFTLNAEEDEVVFTRRGTRPGSPLADIGFNLLMTEILGLLQSTLGQCAAYNDGLRALGTTIPPVTWVDDLAIPLTTRTPDGMIPLIKEVTAILHQTFQRFGMSMNMERGKTEVVLMYRGRNANVHRTALFDTAQAPAIVTSTPTHVLTIRVVPSYRHLGARYSMDLDIQEELQARMAMAKKAFAEMWKPLFGNRLLDLKAKTQLYRSLILSRLLYGSAVWSDVPATLVKQVEAMLIAHYRRIHNVGFWQSDNLTDEAFLNMNELIPFRVEWARQRLVFLQHLAQQASSEHRDALLAEHAGGRGWLHEVRLDLQWLVSLAPLPFDPPAHRDDWIAVLDSLATYRAWKPLIKRAVLRHAVQERLAWEVKYYHNALEHELSLCGATIVKPDEIEHPAPATVRHVCPDCDAVFPSKQQLALHAFRKHGIQAQERAYVQSTVCAGCLKDFHTTFRVTQHLRHRPNGCWDRVYLARPPADPVTIDLPPHLQKVKRLPAFRRHHGPLRPTSVQRRRISLCQQIAAVKAEGQSEFAWWHPPAEDPLVQRAMQQLSLTLRTWCALDEPNLIQFHDMMFAELFDLQIDDAKCSRLFIHWVERFMHEACPDDLDPDIALTLEHVSLTMLEDLPTWRIQQRMKSLVAQWTHLPSDYPDFDRALPADDPRPYDRAHEVCSLFQHLGQDERTRWRWTFSTRPQVRPVASHGPYYVVHLYSGRRREGDFQSWFTESLDPQLRGCVYVLSLDTAISATMNIHSPALWALLLDLARGGRLLALLLGPPCETWSSARYHALTTSDGQDDQVARPRGPRPLRSAASLWALDLRSLSELLQLSVGNCLLFKGLWLSVAVACRSGAVILEHPAMPFDEELPSIWRTGILRLLLRGGHPFRKVTIGQWRFGASSVKPTTFLYSRGPLPDTLASCELPNVVKPTFVLLGRDHQGQFCTAQAKEYPSALSKAFAVHFCSQLPYLLTRSDRNDQEADQGMTEFIRLSTCLDGGVRDSAQGQIAEQVKQTDGGI